MTGWPVIRGGVPPRAGSWQVSNPQFVRPSPAASIRGLVAVIALDRRLRVGAARSAARKDR
ncbi:hypothetical protein [Mycobacterium timonense]|uniref:hypothetical protein n=1 Tax=Mycobacterium timonense TaxID=701043 RepID=UPI0013D20626|nr:hypothetical protein [Mycobacterium timonense]